MIKMTREEALAKQAEQLAFYTQGRPDRDWLRPHIASLTRADMLTPGVMYDVVEVNRYIPRGGKIEHAIMQREG